VLRSSDCSEFHFQREKVDRVSLATALTHEGQTTRRQTQETVFSIILTLSLTLVLLLLLQPVICVRLQDHIVYKKKTPESYCYHFRFKFVLVPLVCTYV